LVCYDSREEGRWDLADKEIAVLIAEVARPGPNVLCVLDCCHSGSGTRAAVEDGIAVRRAPTDRRHRPVESFLDGVLAVARRGDDSSSTGWGVVPIGKHLLLAACRSSEAAKEVIEAGKPHGAFTAALLAALRQTGGSITYRDLLKRAEAQVRLRVAQQVPQVEAVDPTDLQRPFLGGAVHKQRAHFTMRRDPKLDWVIDGGAIHGIARPVGTETTVLAVFDLTDRDGRRLTDAVIATAEVEEVRAELSRVRLSPSKGPLDPSSTYRAVVVATPLPALGVHLTGARNAVERVRIALAEAGEGGGPSTLVREIGAEDEAELLVDAKTGAWRISRARSDRPLLGEIIGVGFEGAKAVVQQLEHIARWDAIARLENPGSRLGADPVEIAVLLPVYGASKEVWLEADPRHGVRLEYRYDAGVWEQPAARIELRNNSREDVYCALLWLGEDYSVSSALIPGGTIHIPAGRSAAANGGGPVWGLVPDDKWHQGRSEVRDLLKLIVSTEQFDPTLFEQAPLDRRVVTRSDGAPRALPRNALERLAARVHYRDLASRPGSHEVIPEWTVGELGITVVRPLEAIEVPSLGRCQMLGAGVILVGHASFKAKARLISPSEAGRGLGHYGLPAVLRDDPEISQPFLFETPRGPDPGLGALQLFQIDNPGTVTAEAPLVLRLETQLRPDEHVLAFAWDGTFFLPLGAARRAGHGTEIELQRLPQPLQTASDVERGMVSSIRILFQKVISQKLGIEFDYPHLAAITFNTEGKPKYDAAFDVVRDRVAQADRILLYVHGILGDTLGMTASSQSEVALSGAPPQRIADLYDLILAFDYENINTGIRETAAALRERLAAVGLRQGHDKTLHIAAHSMGGLISRWFIEREGGDKIVQHLVTLGTPHGGSPWPTIQDWANAALAIGLNGLAQVAWPVRLLGDLICWVETLDVMLDEMAPNSPFLAELAQNADPHVLYTLLVGNTSVIPAAVDDGKLGKLLARLSQRILHSATSLAFLRAPNDIAVSVASAQAVPAGRVPTPVATEVACDHLTFFGLDAGSQALLKALQRAEPGRRAASPKLLAFADKVIE
jgi:hypothetical protein